MKLTEIVGEKDSRRRKSLIRGAAVIGILLMYYVFTQITGLFIPCMFHLVTGLYCPGCGVSHLCTDLLRLDPASAFHQNAAVFGLLPVWIVFGALRLLFPGRIGERAQNAVAIVSLVILILFGILRNLPGLEFLQPLYAR